MITVIKSLSAVNNTALDLAIRGVLGSKYFGFSTWQDGRPAEFYFDDTATPGNLASVDTLVTAHDPVFISVDKTAILADDTDIATVTISAPKPGAAAVSLSLNGAIAAVTLTNGQGTIVIASKDTGTITITVVSGANRCSDTLTITAQ